MCDFEKQATLCLSFRSAREDENQTQGRGFFSILGNCRKLGPRRQTSDRSKREGVSLPPCLLVCPVATLLIITVFVGSPNTYLCAPSIPLHCDCVCCGCFHCGFVSVKFSLIHFCLPLYSVGILNTLANILYSLLA